MNITILSPFFYPHIGGMERSLLNLCQGLLQRKHSVDLYTMPEKGRKSLQFKIFECEEKNTKNWAAGLKSFIDKTTSDVMIFAGLGADSLEEIKGAVDQCKLKGIKSILRVPTSDHLERHLEKEDKRRYLSIFDSIVCIEKTSFEFVKSLGLKSLIIQIQNGVNTEIFRPKVEFEKRDDVIAWIGRIAHRKRPYLFLKLAKTLPSYRFLLQAAPTYRQESMYKEFMEEAENTDNIEILEPNWNSESTYQKAGFLFLPSTSEGTANAFLEALSTRVICIASDIPESHQALNDFGYFINFGDEFWVRQVKRAIKNKSRNNEIVSNSREYVCENYSYDLTLYRWGALFDKLFDI